MTEAPAKPVPVLLPEERGLLYLWVRRGLPIGTAIIAFAGGALQGSGSGWWLLAGVAALAVAWPTFLRGEAFGRRRTAIMRQDSLWANALRPLARWLDLEDAWILSYCGFNNQRVRAAFETRRARRVLILLPHCIQLARCKADVLGDLETCYDCGLCPVGDYRNAALLNRWDGHIFNRSHKAYRDAREHRPDLIVAVSCTDRLLKGLTRLPEIPSYVIPLTLGHGMCVDTEFSLPHLFAAMEALAQPIQPMPKVQPLVREA